MSKLRFEVFGEIPSEADLQAKIDDFEATHHADPKLTAELRALPHAFKTDEPDLDLALNKTFRVAVPDTVAEINHCVGLMGKDIRRLAPILPSILNLVLRPKDQASLPWHTGWASALGTFPDGLTGHSLTHSIFHVLNQSYPLHTSSRLVHNPFADMMIGKLKEAGAAKHEPIPLDMSKETLDSRFTAAKAGIQLATTDLFLRYTFLLGCADNGGWHRRDRLMRELAPGLFTQFDLAHAKAAMQAIAVEYGKLLDPRFISDVQAIAALTWARDGTQKVADHIDTAQDFFRQVYTNLEHDLPKELRLPPEQIAAGVGSTATKVEVQVEVDVPPEPDPAVLEMLSRRVGAIENATGRLREAWTLTSNAKRKPYNPLENALRIEGVNNADEIVHTLVRLENLGRRHGANSPKELAKVMASYNLIIRARRGLFAWADKQYVTAQLKTHPPQLKWLIDTISLDWPALQEDILQHWPNDKGAVAVTHIEHALRGWQVDPKRLKNL